MVLSAGGAAASAEFSGDVRPRYESRLGFRVAGKISARQVDVGNVVKRGQVLMQLDPQDLRLGQVQAQASLRAAQTEAELAAAELKRYQGLREQNFVSQAVLDQKAAAARSSQSSAEAARAALRNQSNQTGYARLVPTPTASSPASMPKSARWCRPARRWCGWRAPTRRKS
jgi:multidrug efflux system membrane fusion protein